MADGGAIPWLVLEQPAGGAGWGGIEEMLDRAGEDKVGSKELFCSCILSKDFFVTSAVKQPCCYGNAS